MFSLPLCETSASSSKRPVTVSHLEDACWWLGFGVHGLDVLSNDQEFIVVKLIAL
jgi:hypothetical protein